MSSMTQTPTEARKPVIGSAFDDVAPQYDRLCSMNPGYLKHLRWSAERLDAPRDGRILDLACGTGLSTTAVVDVYPEAHVVGVDVSPGMLEHARRKPGLSRVRFEQGDAMALPEAASGPFDAILMAYGIRNVPDPDACLRGLLGALKPGGVLCLHEYSVADSRRSRLVWNLVSFGVVIPLAKFVTGSTDIFRYLRRSVNEFDGVSRLEQRLHAAGFTGVETLPMDGWQKGVTHSFRARRPQG